MKRLFIKTVNQGGEGLDTTGAKIVFGANSTPLVNVGPEGAVAITETNANICLTEPFVVNAASVIESDPITLEGNYVVQIGEDVIPLIFKAEDLPHYFDGKNTNNVDIQFSVYEVPTPIENKDPTVKFIGNNSEAVTVSVTGNNAKWSLVDEAGKVIQDDTVNTPYVGILNGIHELRVTSTNTQELNILVAGPGLTEIRSYPLQKFNSISHFDSSAISTNLIEVPTIGPSVVSMFGMFRGATSFNSTGICYWAVKEVENMGRMLDEATSFSQNLSNWCVTNIYEAPPVFNGQGKLTPAQMPVWGTCPRVNPAIGSNSTAITLNSFNFAAANNSNFIITTDRQVDVMWGDGSKSSAISTDGTMQTFTIRMPDYIKNERGEHQIVINNTTPYGLRVIGDGFSKINKWSDVGYTKVELNCVTLTNVPATAPKGVTNFDGFFFGCNALNDPNIANWDVSKVTSFINCFVNCYQFNQDIGKWVVSAVPSSYNMGSMLANTMAFNQDLSKWCVTKVKEKPLDFNEGSAIPANFLPVWGTCPNRNG